MCTICKKITMKSELRKDMGLHNVISCLITKSSQIRLHHITSSSLLKSSIPLIEPSVKSNKWDQSMTSTQSHVIHPILLKLSTFNPTWQLCLPFLSIAPITQQSLPQTGGKEARIQPPDKFYPLLCLHDAFRFLFHPYFSLGSSYLFPYSLYL